MCSARLFTAVVTPDFTERRSAVCAKRANVIARVYFVDRSYFFLPDHQQARNQGNQGGAGGRSLACNIFRPSGKMGWTFLKTIGHSLKNLGPSQKTLRHS